jgi:NDP-sugar pyrophosphorylase family protein
MEVIVPAAGLSTRFPDMPPKYMLEDANGKLMIENAIEPYPGRHPITIIILLSHEMEYNVTRILLERLGDGNVKFLILPNETRGPADTVYQFLKNYPNNDSILIKDCDSYFNHVDIPGSYMCVQHMPRIDRRLANKSFCVMEGENVRTVVEKAIASRYYNVGGYKFNSVRQYIAAYNGISTDGEQFISSVVNKSIEQGHQFKTVTITDYVDVGTIDEWKIRNQASPQTTR